MVSDTPNSLEDTTDLIELILQTSFDKLSFGNMLKRVIFERDGKNSEIIMHCHLEKSHFYQYLRNDRVPRRDTIIKIALVLQLEIDSVNKLLSKAGHNELRWDNNRRDSVLHLCINKKKTLIRTQELLQEIGEQYL
jgi:hypothetical protein